MVLKLECCIELQLPSVIQWLLSGVETLLPKWSGW